MGGSLADTDGHLDAGEYQVCFTFTDERGREGGASASAALNVALGGILVTDIPAAPGCVTNVYVADRGTVFYLAATLAQGTQAITINRPPAGRELVTQFLDAPPAAGRHVAEFGGRIYMAEYLAESNASAIWRSEPLGFHLFNLNEGFFMVPGEVTQLASARSGPLVICTQNRTHIYDGESMQTVEYGAVPGQHASRGPDGRLYFWTSRGLCRAAPFENLTESRVSVPPGLCAADDTEAILEAAKEEQADTDRELQKVLDLKQTVSFMDKDALKQFALTNYNQKLDGRLSVEALREQTNQMIDQFGVV